MDGKKRNICHFLEVFFMVRLCIFVKCAHPEIELQPVQYVETNVDHIYYKTSTTICFYRGNDPQTGRIISCSYFKPLPV